MPDNKRKKKQDAKLVSFNQDYEVRYIAKKFGVSMRKVRLVINKVGHSRRKVYAELRC